MAREKLDPSVYQQVMERDRWQCTNPLCRRKDRLEIDHVIKRSQRGPVNEPAALVTLCHDCHMLKEEGILVVIPTGDGTFRHHDTRRILCCEICARKIQKGDKALVPTGGGGQRWVIVGRPADGRPA